ncbi:MAG: transcriptional repressor [Gaiellales bacterium]
MTAEADRAAIESQARAELQSHSLRATSQRMLVLTELMRTKQDATAQELHTQLRRAAPSLGLATVYRTLGKLVEAGVLDALQHGHGTCYRWCAPGHHHHLTCVRCHSVVELHDCGVGAWADEIGATHGFTQVRHMVELSGLCASCTAV